MLATQDFKETGRGDQLIAGAREPSLQAPDLETTAQGSTAGVAGTKPEQLGGTSGTTGTTGVGNEAQRGALTPEQIKDISSPESQQVQNSTGTMAHTLFNPNNVRKDGRPGWDEPPKENWPLINAFEMGGRDARSGFSKGAEEYKNKKEKQAYELGLKYATGLITGSPIDVTNEAANLIATEAPIVKIGKPKGRPKAELTPEQVAAKAETRKQAQAAGRDAIRTADRAEKTLAQEFDPSSYDDLDTAKIALDEFNEKRRQALEDAYGLSVDPAQRLNTAGKKAKALLEKANPQERELAKNRHETRQKLNAPSRAEITEFTNGEDNPVFEKFTNAKAALNWIAKNGNDFEQALAKRLAPFLNGVKIVVVDSHTELPTKSLQNQMRGAAGLYVSGRNTIYLMRDGGINNTVVLHETLHGATVNRINSYLQARLEGREVDAKLRVAVVELQETMADAKALYDKLKEQGMLSNEMLAIPYVAFEDIKEFVAYGLSLPAMQDFLMLAPGEYIGEKQNVITGLFTRFVQSLRKMFNMGEEHSSAFQDLIIVTDKLLATTPTQIPDTGEALAAKQRKKKEKADKVLEKIQKGEFADEVGGLIGELIRIRSWGDAKDVFKASWKTIDSKTIQALMPTLTSMQIIDWVGDKIPHLNNVARASEKMSVMRSKMLARVSDLSVPWVQFASKYIAGGKTLSTLMHYTTLTEVDPTLHKNLADALQNDTQLIDLRQKYAAAPAKSKAAAKGQITKRERKITQAYGLWNKLGQFGKVDQATGLSQGQQIYSSVKQYYKNTFNLHRAILDERIANANVPGDINDASTPKGKLMAAIRTTYEASKTIGVYFPLMRYGQYWVRVGKGQSREFYMFESEFQRNNFIAKRVKQLRKINPNATEAQLRTDDDLDSGNDLAKLRKASTESSEMLKKIFEIIDTTGMQDKEALKDSVYQMYLLTMPEQSFRGQFIHRKGTAGFSGDALRNFVRSGYTSSGQLSTLKYGPEIFREMDAAEAALEGNPDKERLSNFTRELRRRVVDEVNPTIEDEIGQRFANGVGQAAFLWFLTSAKSAIINMSAIPIFGMPVLASKYGNINTAKVLGSYGNIFNHTTLVKRDADGSLSYTPLSVGFSKHVRENPILAAAFSEAAERGVTEITRTYDLISMAKTPSTKFTGRASRFVRGSINMVGAMFHHSERINREIMYMSSFELAYAKALKDGLAGGINGAAFNRAVDESVKNTYDSMFNYTKFNRPRIMRHWTTKIMLQFKLFPQQVTGYFVRNYMTMYHASIAAIKNIDNKQERDAALADLNEGATQFFGSLIMTGMFAGIVGMPLYSATIGVIQGIMAALRDEDEPVPFEERDLDYWFRYVFLPKYFGDDFARIIQKGPISAISGIDVASSTSLDNLWFRDTQDDKSLLTDFRNQVIGALGPSAGLAENFVKAYEDWKNGHVSQAIEKAVPGLFKGMVAQLRWGQEGVTAKTTKAEIMSKEEISVATRFWKTLGFNPTELSIQQDKNFKVIEQFRKTEQEYGEIMSHIKTDSMNGNFNRLDKDIEKFVKFAIQNPDMDVDPDSIFTAIENAEIARAEAINGVVVSNEKLRARAHYLLDVLEKKTPH